MNKKLLSALIFLLLVVGVVTVVIVFSRVKISGNTNLQQTVSTVPEDDLTKEIRSQFATKYNKPSNAVQLEVEVSLDKFARGTVRFDGEQSGAIWFAANIGNKWVLADDGQGPMTCETADKYSFPANLVPICINAGGDLHTR